MLKSIRLASVIVTFAALVLGACGGDTPACDDNDCVLPPQPHCEGQISIEYEPNGYCDNNGRCAYDLDLDTADPCGCVPEGVECEYETGPCAGVICEQPPGDHCDGDVLVSYDDTTAGECVSSETDDGVQIACVYDRQEEDCTDNDQICFNGECTDITCTHMVCNTPPDAICETDADGNQIAVTYAQIGQCASATCSYPELARDDCTANGEICVDGACENLCTGNTCTSPPDDLCEDNTAIHYNVVGICDADTGECTYLTTEEDCGDRVCADGACQVSCDGVVCEAPPPSRCEADLAYSYEAGACEDGACVYDEVVEDCAAADTVCLDGACVDGCTGIVCDTPPDLMTCEGDVAVSYAGEGVCNADSGLCEYTEVREDCSADGGFCVGGTCATACDMISCLSPPGSTCIGDVAHGYEVPGVCSDGDCSYPPTTQDCSESGQVCRDGFCEDFCSEGFVCDESPDPHCDGDEVVTYQVIGTCGDGGCTYPELAREDCALEGGTCVAAACHYESDLCDGVDCVASPTPFCDGNVGVTYFPIGECIEGECVYTEQRTDCTDTGETCNTGYCYDACHGVSCNTPPLNGCVGDEIVTYANPGDCDAGMCTYPEDRTDCTATSETCFSGDCVDPCMLISCATPPPAECFGNRLRVYYGVGTCSAGTCGGYPYNEGNCEALGQVCVAGACVADPCDGVSCNTPPLDTRCEGDTSYFYNSPGTCVAGTCEYTELPFDCTRLGLVCDPALGECADP